MVKGDQMNRITAFADPAQDQSLIDRITEALDFHQDRIQSAKYALDQGWIDQPEHDARLDRARKITTRILTRTYGGKQ